MSSNTELLQLDSNLPVYLLSSFRAFKKGEQHVERIADFDVMILVLEGELNFLEENVPVSLKKGDWYVQKSGRRQLGLENTDSPHYFYIHFRGYYAEDGRGLPFRGVFPVEAMTPTLNQLHIAENSNLTKIELMKLFYEILSQLYNLQFHEANKLASEVQSYLAAHYNQKMKINEIAKVFGYSTDYIIRIYKRAFNITPYQYITGLRFNHAQQLLLTTNRSIQEISEQTGFGDSISLYKAFKRIAKKSPKQWKAEFRHKNPPQGWAGF